MGGGGRGGGASGAAFSLAAEAKMVTPVKAEAMMVTPRLLTLHTQDNGLRVWCKPALFSSIHSAGAVT